MTVKELRKKLRKLPGEMPVYNLAGWGLVSVQHTFKANLIEGRDPRQVEQFLELLFWTEEGHTPQFQDTLIERETGFKNRRELLNAYKALAKESA